MRESMVYNVKIEDMVLVTGFDMKDLTIEEAIQFQKEGLVFLGFSREEE